ncbi:MAG: DUF2231 domain-containing protein [Gemmatimonadales bacterium]
MWDTPAEFHAALNDLPVALLLISVVFQWIAVFSGKESMRTVAYWTLLVGAGSAVATVFSGLIAEDWVEHGSEVHRFIERHETLAIMMTVLFVGLAGWQLFRRGVLAKVEQRFYLGAATVGVGLLLWVGHVGGIILFRQGTGIPTSVLEATIEDRVAGHSHEAGQEDDDNGEDAAAADEDHEH